MRYFIDYYKAKDYANKHGLHECEYGDVDYLPGHILVSYVGYNKSGEREDEWEVECYYTWYRDNSRPGRNMMIPSKDTDKYALREWAERTLGVTELEGEDE